MSALRVKNQRILSLLKEIAKTESCCPSHSMGYSHASINNSSAADIQSKEYAFEMASSNIRYGRGVTAEVGMDLANLGAKKILIVTDKTISKLSILTQVLNSLQRNKIAYELFDDVHVEPTDASVIEATQFALNKTIFNGQKPFDAFIAVGGGSAMDTCKVVNLLTSENNINQCEANVEKIRTSLMKYVNAPIGRGDAVHHPLKPLYAIPTTAGTGSETTGVAIFDILSMGAKTGIAHRNLRPTLGLVDPDHTRYLPTTVATYSGFDVFCHALESFTALPYHERTPRPSNPLLRPAYQGSNPISDVWARYAMNICAKYFRRAVKHADDDEARGAMHLASTCAGVGFGNAGVHLCHAMSYPISGMARTYRPPLTDYPCTHHHHHHSHQQQQQQQEKPALIPHGLSVVINAPAVFRFTSPLCPDRHLEAAQLLKPQQDFSRVKQVDSGKVLADVILEYMSDLGIPNGLVELGYSTDDIPKLVDGVMPQHRITKLSPRSAQWEDIQQLFENSFRVYNN